MRRTFFAAICNRDTYENRFPAKSREHQERKEPLMVIMLFASVILLTVLLAAVIMSALAGVPR
jgi:hypothetical protein